MLVGRGVDLTGVAGRGGCSWDTAGWKNAEDGMEGVASAVVAVVGRGGNAGGYAGGDSIAGVGRGRFLGVEGTGTVVWARVAVPELPVRLRLFVGGSLS